ncbi:hypothetical protein PROFUN_16778, partial [Planoprotostelium fungivorum]
GLKRMTEGQWMYHWADLSNSVRWMAAGRIDQGELNWFNSLSSNMYAGGGFYMSTDPTDSVSYGTTQIRIWVPANTLLFDGDTSFYCKVKNGTQDDANISQCFNRYYDDSEKSWLGTIVPFIHQYRGDNWRVVHSEILTAKIEPGIGFQRDSPESLRSALRTHKPQIYISYKGIYNELDRIVTAEKDPIEHRDQGANYLLRQFNRIDFHGLLYATARVVTDTAGSYSASEDLELKFLSMQLQRMNDAYSLDHFLSGDGKSLDYVVSTVVYTYKNILGYSTWRDSAQFMGSEANGTHRLTVNQFARMQRNPLLNLESVGQADNGDVLVNIQHVDIFNYTKAYKAGYINQDLYNTLTSYNSTQYRNNPSLARNGNSQLVQGLLKDIFVRHIGKPFPSGTISLYADLLALSPYQNNSDILALGIVQMMAMQNLNKTLHPAIDPKWTLRYHEFGQPLHPVLRSVWFDDAQKSSDLIREADEEMLRSWYYKYVPSYRDMFFKQACVLPSIFQGRFNFDDGQVKMILDGKYIDLFDSAFPNWRSVDV